MVINHLLSGMILQVWVYVNTPLGFFKDLYKRFKKAVQEIQRKARRWFDGLGEVRYERWWEKITVGNYVVTIVSRLSYFTPILGYL